MSNLEKVALSNQLQWPVLWEADNMENAKFALSRILCLYHRDYSLIFIANMAEDDARNR